MADELKIKQRRFGRKADIGIQRRKGAVETESSIFKQLEEEDLQRFAAVNANAYDVKKAYQEKIYNGDNGKESKKEISRKFEKIKKNSGRNELTRSKGQRIGRFLQKRLGSRVNKRWHSDSELLDSTSRGASVASGKSKVDFESTRKQSHHKHNLLKDTVIPQSSKGHQKKVCSNHRQVQCGEPSEKEDLALTSLKDVGHSNGVNDKQVGVRHSEVCNWMNCSFPVTMKEEEKRRDICEFGGSGSDQSGVLNLLIEYFKDLNKEVREFREEKKKTREQIQYIELKVEKLTARLEAHNEMTMNEKGKETRNGKQFNAENMIEDTGDGGKARKGKEKHVIARDENVCMEIEARPEIRQEIRNILSDVHDKYHKQLVEHEKRMKSVQEKAEFDIQKLMKTIIGNYVELSHLRGTGKELGKLIDQGIFEGGDVHSFARKSGCNRKSDQKLEPASQGVELSSNESARLLKTSQQGKTRAEMVQNTYQFYFPRQGRDDSKSLQKKDALQKRDTDTQRKNEHLDDQNETKDESSEGKTIAGAREGNVSENPGKATGNLEKIKIIDSNIPDGLGASYLEWKQYWRDKLMKRNALLKTKFERKVAEGGDNDGGDNDGVDDDKERCNRNIT